MDTQWPSGAQPLLSNNLLYLLVFFWISRAAPIGTGRATLLAMRRVTRRMLLSLGAGALLAGCLSPTLPLPPPSPPDVTQIGQGRYELNGSLPMRGTVFVQNERTSLVFGETVEQLYRFTVSAEAGDAMSLWYEAGDASDGFYGDRSQTISFDIPDKPFVPPDAGTDGAP